MDSKHVVLVAFSLPRLFDTLHWYADYYRNPTLQGQNFNLNRKRSEILGEPMCTRVYRPCTINSEFEYSGGFISTKQFSIIQSAKEVSAAVVNGGEF